MRVFTPKTEVGWRCEAFRRKIDKCRVHQTPTDSIGSDKKLAASNEAEKIFDGNDLHHIIFYLAKYCTPKWMPNSSRLIFNQWMRDLCELTVKGSWKKQSHMQKRIFSRVPYMRKYCQFAMSADDNDIHKAGALWMNRIMEKICIIFEVIRVLLHMYFSHVVVA